MAASVADADAVNANGNAKTLLSSGLNTFPIKGNPNFRNSPKILPKNPSDCSILWNCVFDNFILTEELFAKALRIEICVLVNNNLYRKLFSSLESPTTFDENLKVISPFHAVIPALRVLFVGPKCRDTRTAGIVYLLSLCGNYQRLHLARRLNMYCQCNYCKYVLRIFIAKVKEFITIFYS